MANTAANNIQFNVKVVNNQLTQYTVEMGSTLAKLTKAMQAMYCRRGVGCGIMLPS